MEIKKISQEVRNQIKKKLPISLPNNPTRQGYSAEKLKKYFGSMALLDDENSIVAEMDRIVDETNNAIKNLENKTNDALNGYTIGTSESYNTGSDKQLPTTKAVATIVETISPTIVGTLDEVEILAVLK